MQITGDTVYNMLRLAEVECDDEERPLNPHKIKTTEVFSTSSFFHLLDNFLVFPVCDAKTFCLFQVLHSPFDDIIPRELKKAKKDKDKEEGKKSQSKATK